MSTTNNGDINTTAETNMNDNEQKAQQIKDTYAAMTADFERDLQTLAELSSGVTFEKSEEKYKENLSTAITFIGCSVIGLGFLALNAFNVLHFVSLETTFGILTTVVMGILFLIFFGIGIYSMKAAKTAKANIAEENSAMAKLNTWMDEHILKEDIENSYNHEGVSEELKYFRRAAYVKFMLKEQFPHFKDELIDEQTDAFLEKLF